MEHCNVDPPAIIVGEKWEEEAEEENAFNARLTDNVLLN